MARVDDETFSARTIFKAAPEGDMRIVFKCSRLVLQGAHPSLFLGQMPHNIGVRPGSFVALTVNPENMVAAL
jgi:hypothetical protein